jgi:hypothetical protein
MCPKFCRIISKENESVTDTGVYFNYLNTIRMAEILGVGKLLAKVGPERRVNIYFRLNRSKIKITLNRLHVIF